jgi:hypothetical protein
MAGINGLNDIADEISIAKCAIALAHANERKVRHECPYPHLNSLEYKAWRKRWQHAEQLENRAERTLRLILIRLGLGDYYQR